ncbi:Octapeptide-repeat protein T2, partial [Ophiophagus hannah]
MQYKTLVHPDPVLLKIPPRLILFKSLKSVKGFKKQGEPGKMLQSLEEKNSPRRLARPNTLARFPSVKGKNARSGPEKELKKPAEMGGRFWGRHKNRFGEGGRKKGRKLGRRKEGGKIEEGREGRREGGRKLGRRMREGRKTEERRKGGREEGRERGRKETRRKEGRKLGRRKEERRKREKKRQKKEGRKRTRKGRRRKKGREEGRIGKELGRRKEGRRKREGGREGGKIVREELRLELHLICLPQHNTTTQSPDPAATPRSVPILSKTGFRVKNQPDRIQPSFSGASKTPRLNFPVKKIPCPPNQEMVPPSSFCKKKKKKKGGQWMDFNAGSWKPTHLNCKHKTIMPKPFPKKVALRTNLGSARPSSETCFKGSSCSFHAQLYQKAIQTKPGPDYTQIRAKLLITTYKVSVGVILLAKIAPPSFDSKKISVSRNCFATDGGSFANRLQIFSGGRGGCPAKMDTLIIRPLLPNQSRWDTVQLRPTFSSCKKQSV